MPEKNEKLQVRISLGILSSSMGIPFSLFMFFFLPMNGETVAGILFLILAIWLLLVIIIYINKHISLFLFAILSFSGLVIVDFLSSISMGGIHGSGVSIVWSLIPAMTAPILIGTQQTLIWLIIFILEVVGNAYLPELWNQSSDLPSRAIQFLFIFNLVGMSVFIIVVIQFFILQRDESEEKSERLLLNILPREIADILRSEQRIVADAFDGVSILFADLVNFTPMSASMKPVDLVNLLNEVFSHFDLLTEKHHLEKIKTIGDCYMVASGIPTPRLNHAQSVTQMALDILQFIKEFEFQGKKLSFRVGINSGSVVAGVIGQKKFAYDLWGDAVNTASRMESSGEGNVIQITRSTYELINDEFHCQARPSIVIKGKGEMEVWHVLGKK